METLSMVTVELIWIQKYNPDDQSRPMVMTIRKFDANLHQASKMAFAAMMLEWNERFPQTDPICPVTGVVWMDHQIIHVPGWNFIGTDYFRIAYKISS